VEDRSRLNPDEFNFGRLSNDQIRCDDASYRIDIAREGMRAAAGDER